MFGSCVLAAASRDPRSLRVRCAAAVALAEEQLGASLPRICARDADDTRASQPA